jgi:hypothetical protein
VKDKAQRRVWTFSGNIEYRIVGDELVDGGLFAQLISPKPFSSGRYVQAFGPEETDMVPQQAAESAGYGQATDLGQRCGVPVALNNYVFSDASRREVLRMKAAKSNICGKGLRQIRAHGGFSKRPEMMEEGDPH